jgi:hypothetical protein
MLCLSANESIALHVDRSVSLSAEGAEPLDHRSISIPLGRLHGNRSYLLCIPKKICKVKSLLHNMLTLCLNLNQIYEESSLLAVDD